MFGFFISHFFCNEIIFLKITAVECIELEMHAKNILWDCNFNCSYFLEIKKRKCFFFCKRNIFYSQKKKFFRRPIQKIYRTQKFEKKRFSKTVFFNQNYNKKNARRSTVQIHVQQSRTMRYRRILITKWNWLKATSFVFHHFTNAADLLFKACTQFFISFSTRTKKTQSNFFMENLLSGI